MKTEISILVTLNMEWKINRENGINILKTF